MGKIVLKGGKKWFEEEEAKKYVIESLGTFYIVEGNTGDEHLIYWNSEDGMYEEISPEQLLEIIEDMGYNWQYVGFDNLRKMVDSLPFEFFKEVDLKLFNTTTIQTLVEALGTNWFIYVFDVKKI